MILLLILLSIDIIKINCNELTFGDCPATDHSIRFTEVEADPDPIIYPNDVVYKLSLQLLKDIPKENSKVKISASKLPPKGMSIGCYFGFGSCAYPYCDFWPPIEHGTTANQGIDCPHIAGNYSWNGKLYLPKSGIISWLRSFLKGNYSIDFTFFNDETKEVYGCSRVNLTVHVDPKFKWNPEERRDSISQLKQHFPKVMFVNN